MTYVKYAMVVCALAGLGLCLVAGIYEAGGHGYAVMGGFALPLILGGVGAASGKGLTRPTAGLCAVGFALAALKMRDAREGELLFILIAAGVGALAAIALLAVKEHTEPKRA